MVSSPGYVKEVSNAWYRHEEQQALAQPIVDLLENDEGDDDYETEISKAREESKKTYGIGPGPLPPIIDLRHGGGEPASSNQGWQRLEEEGQGCRLPTYGPAQQRMGDRLKEAREIKKLELTKNFEAKRKNMDEAEGRVAAIGAGRVRIDATNRNEGRDRDPGA